MIPAYTPDQQWSLVLGFIMMAFGLSIIIDFDSKRDSPREIYKLMQFLGTFVLVFGTVIIVATVS